MIYLTPNEASSLSTNEILIEIREHIRNLAKELWEEELLYKVGEKLDKVGRKISITWTDISSCWGKSKAKKPLKNDRQSRIIKTHFSYAFLYYKKAKIKAHNGDEVTAIKLATYAAYHLGALDNQIKSIKESIKNKARAKLGGLTKSEIRKTVRAQLAEYLKSPPPKGWRNIPDAIKAIEPKLEKFIISNNYGKVITDTEEFIANEIDESRPLHATFLENTVNKQT